MPLATTALTDFWPEGDEIVLLGPWCLAPGSKDALATRRVRELPCPWDDPAALNRTRVLLTETYESTLAALGEYLNETHEVDRSSAYWRIVLGPWLIQHLHPLYDRYVTLTQALALEPDAQTLLMPQADWRTPRTTHDATQLSLVDPYNVQLYSQVLRALGATFPDRPFRWPEATPREKLEARLRAAVRFVRTSGRTGRWPAATIVDPYVSPKFARRLANSAGFGFRELPHLRTFPPEYDERRAGLRSILAPRTEFETVLFATLPVALPTIFLEGYAPTADRLDALSRNTRVVASATGWLFPDQCKLAAAAAAERGARTIVIQHGGGYGMSRWLPFEEHEGAVADVHFVWGWANDLRGKENLPSLKLATVSSRRPRRPRHPHELLFVGTAHPPYLYRFQAHPLGAQWKRYEDFQRRFLAALDPGTRRSVRIRLDTPTYGRDLRSALVEAAPEAQFDEGDFYASVDAATCVVVDHCTTVFLETMHLDVPTIVFWDPSLWQLRDEAQPYLSMLEDARIYHRTPEAAAAAVTEAGPNYMRWWTSGAVRAARTSFLERYALSANDAFGAWERRLLEESARARTARMS